MAGRSLATDEAVTLENGVARTRRGKKITGLGRPVVAPRRKPVAVGRLVAVAGLVGLGRAPPPDEPPRSLGTDCRGFVQKGSAISVALDTAAPLKCLAAQRRVS